MVANPPDWANVYFDPADIASHAHFATEHGPIDAWFRQTPGQDGIFRRTAFTAEPLGEASD